MEQLWMSRRRHLLQSVFDLKLEKHSQRVGWPPLLFCARGCSAGPAGPTVVNCEGGGSGSGPASEVDGRQTVPIVP